jgi:hypothetical protein
MVMVLIDGVVDRWVESEEENGKVLAMPLRLHPHRCAALCGVAVADSSLSSSSFINQPTIHPPSLSFVVFGSSLPRCRRRRRTHHSHKHQISNGCQRVYSSEAASDWHQLFVGIHASGHYPHDLLALV